MKATTNTLYVFAAAAALALSSCKDARPEQTTTNDMDMTSDSVEPANSDAAPIEDSTAINPDTIMGP